MLNLYYLKNKESSVAFEQKVEHICFTDDQLFLWNRFKNSNFLILTNSWHMIT